MALELVPCPDCGVMVPETNVELHQMRSCLNRKPRARNHRCSPAPTTAETNINSTSSSACSPIDIDDDDDDSVVEVLSSGRVVASTAAARLPHAIHRQREVIDLLEDDERVEDGNDGAFLDSESSVDESTWTCATCTLINQSSIETCEACNNPSPNYAQEQRPLPIPRDPVDIERLQHLFEGTDGSSDDEDYFVPEGVAGYVSGGAVLGGILGAAGAYVGGGRSVGRAALSGAIHGAVGGAVLNRVVISRESPRTSPNRAILRASWRSPTRDRNMRIGTTDLDQFMRTLSPTTAHRIHASQNVDNMDYEQLLQLFGDGSENRGADPNLVSRLPTSVIDDPSEISAERASCAICLEEFKKGETQKNLPCLHGFHAMCVDQWLLENGCCPCCKHRIKCNS